MVNNSEKCHLFVQSAEENPECISFTRIQNRLKCPYT